VELEKEGSRVSDVMPGTKLQGKGKGNKEKKFSQSKKTLPEGENGTNSPVFCRQWDTLGARIFLRESTSEERAEKEREKGQGEKRKFMGVFC